MDRSSKVEAPEMAPHRATSRPATQRGRAEITEEKDADSQEGQAAEL